MLDCSFGIIPYCLRNNQLVFFLVWETYGEGHWNFPKGHPEEGEKPLDTALRELYEETTLIPVEILQCDPLIHEYSFEYDGEIVARRIEYFLALVEDRETTLQKDEIGKSEWMTLEELMMATPYVELQQLAQTAYKIIMD